MLVWHIAWHSKSIIGTAETLTPADFIDELRGSMPIDWVSLVSAYDCQGRLPDDLDKRLYWAELA